MTLLNQFRDKAARTYGEPRLVSSWATQVQRRAFVKGACYAAAHFHGVAVGDYKASRVADHAPSYEEAEGVIETAANASGYGQSETDLERKAYKFGAKWVLETLNPRLRETPVVSDRLDAIKTEASKTFFGPSSHLCEPFIEGACFATARFHGIAVWGYSATHESMRPANPKYEELKETISQAAADSGYPYKNEDREPHEAFRRGAKWIMDNFSPVTTSTVKDFVFTRYTPIAIEVTSDGKFAATAMLGDSFRTVLMEFTIPKGSPWTLEDVLRRLNGVK